MRLSTFNRRLRDGTAWTTGWTREEIDEPMVMDEPAPGTLEAAKAELPPDVSAAIGRLKDQVYDILTEYIDETIHQGEWDQFRDTPESLKDFGLYLMNRKPVP